MHYDEVIATIFDAPRPEGVPAPTLEPSPARALRDAIEPLAMHAVWSRRTNEALAEHGLDFFGAYVWGRSAALGTPSPAVVAATFAVFEPTVIAGVAAQAQATCPRATLVEVRTSTTAASLADTLASPDTDTRDLDHVIAALERAAAAADATGRPLFAGLRDQPRPDDPSGRLWRACDLLREHRGDGHLAVCTARGLDPVAMNVLTELWLGMPLDTYSATRFWPPERRVGAADSLRRAGWLDHDGLTDEGRAARQTIEDDTDRLDRTIVDALGDDLDTVVERCSEWSEACVRAGYFPPDPYKRAAG